jgi:hypothetical protein
MYVCVCIYIYISVQIVNEDKNINRTIYTVYTVILLFLSSLTICPDQRCS